MDTGPTSVRSPVAFVLLVSIAFHATLIATGYALREMYPRPLPELREKKPPIEIVEVTLPAPEPAPLEVATAQPEPDPVRPEMSAPKAIARGPARAAATTATTAIEPGAGSNEDPRTVNPMFSMRNDRQIDLRLRPQLHDPLDRAPRGTDAVREQPPSGELAPSGGGTHRSDKGVFTAKVNRDGSVDLKDARNLRVSIPDPRKLPGTAARKISEWAAKDDKTPHDPEREAINTHRPQDTDTRPDHGKTVKIIGGGFDVTDALMRRKKIDPYAAAKLKYLDSTRDERVQIGNRYRKQQLAQSAALMQKNLDALTASTADAVAKKQALFELWDDCAETGSEALVEGGKAARALVIGYLRARFPAGSATAYTAAELERFNRRKASKATFEPYR
jgi:hypothetical protein